MDDIMKYIFDSLRKTDTRLYTMNRMLNRQHGFNRKVMTFMIFSTAHMITAGIDRRDQAMRIRKLEKEIEEMKHPKGDDKGCDD